MAFYISRINVDDIVKNPDSGDAVCGSKYKG